MLLTVKCVLSVLTVVGNVFVIAAFFIRPAIRNTRSNIFIISLGMRERAGSIVVCFDIK